jgi:Ca2+-binding EF-hand superfamily protein
MKKRVNNRQRLLFLAMSTAVLLPMTVSAQERGDRQAFRAEMEALVKERFARLDTDGSGIVSYDEMLAGARARFDEYDGNSDGFLSHDELPAIMPVPEYVQKLRELRQQRFVERGGDAEKAEKRFGDRQPTRIRFVARMDKDHDELVSFDEFTKPAIRMFKRADGDGNGEVTEEEMIDSLKRRGKGWKKRGGNRRRS